MATHNRPDPEAHRKKEDSQDEPDEAARDLASRLGDVFTAGQMIKAAIAGATSAVVREGIETILKHHGG